MNKYGIPVIETHAHTDHQLYEGRGAELVKEQFEYGIKKIVVPAITYDSNFAAREQLDEFDHVFFAAGIHPKYAMNESDWDNAQSARFEALLSEPKTVAVKTGLDFAKKSITDAQVSKQIAFMKRLISYAHNFDLPLVFHVRGAMEAFMNVLKEYRIHTAAEIHCYCDSILTAERLMEHGIRYFGIGGAFTRKDSLGEYMFPELREFVRLVPAKMILLETDAPFQRPHGVEIPQSEYCDNKLNTSLALVAIAEEIARLRGDISPEDLIEASNHNAERFFFD